MKLRDRTNITKSPDPVIFSSRSLLKLGGGLKCSPTKKENFSVIVKRYSKDIQKSISIYSTQNETPIKDDYNENCHDLATFFQSWKNFLVNKKLAWEILFPEFKKLMKKNRKIFEFCLKVRQRCMKKVCFYEISRNRGAIKNFKPVFIKKFLKAWKKFVKVMKERYARTYIIQEKQCGRIEKCMMGVWRKKLALKRKINLFISKRNTKLLKINFQLLKSLSKAHKKSKSIIKFFYLNKIKSLKTQFFWNWFKNIQKKKNLTLNNQVSDYKKKINTLEAQLFTTLQDLTNERKLSTSRDDELKSLLKLHADTLYKSLCEN